MTDLSVTRRDFYAKVYALTLLVTKSEFWAEFAAAMACVETGWGLSEKWPPQSNNLLGIKSSGTHPAYDGYPHLRAFSSELSCIRAWWYLIDESSNYTQPRKKLAAHLEALHNQRVADEIEHYHTFMRGFLSIYCPNNPEYPAIVLQINTRMRDHIERFGEDA